MYFNNIFIYSENEEQHINYVRKVLKVLKKANLELKPKKSFFYIIEINYLEFVISKNSI